MKISIDIVEHDMRDYVVKKHILDTSKMCLVKCAFYDLTDEIKPDTIYVCRRVEQLDMEKLPLNCNLIFLEAVPQIVLEQLEQANYLIVAGLPIFRLINILMDIFHKYRAFDEHVTKLIQCKCSYQELIDLCTEVLQMPLCMLNLNYQTIAVSHVDIPEDSLWAAMQNGYGLAYYDFIQRCEFKTEEMSREGLPQKSTWSDLAGNYLCVNVLYLNGRAIGSIGMHKWYERKKPFEKSMLQLFNYVVTRISELIQLVQNIPESRYAPTDIFLLELLTGKGINDQVLEEMLDQTGLPMDGAFHLAVFFPNDKVCRTEQLLDYVEIIEQLQPDMHCCIRDTSIVGLHICPTGREFEIKQALIDYLKSIEYRGIISLEYSNLMDTGKSFQTLEILRDDVLQNAGQSHICYAHDYLLEYALTVLIKHVDLSKLIHPVLQKLIAYDTRSKGELYNVLKTFLYNRCSLKATSDSMFLHRNTLASRLANIKEITGVDLEDVDTYKQLIFSVSCLDYYNKMDPARIAEIQNDPRIS